MRRLLTAGAVAATMIVAFAFSRTASAPAMAAQSGMAIPATRPNSLGEVGKFSPPAVIVASNVSARAVAVHKGAIAESTAFYYTEASQLSRIFSVDLNESEGTSAVAGSGKVGFLGDGGDAAAAEFNLKLDSLVERSGIAIAADGTIFISDTRNATIRRIAGPESSEPGIVRSVAGHWAPPQNVALAEPMGIVLDRAGNLYIADHGANAVVVLRAATGQIEILAQVGSPASVAVTPDGSKVFVSSPETGAVFSIETATRSIAEILPPRPARKPPGPAYTAAGIAVDGGGNLFVADASANQILRFSAAASKPGAPTIYASGLHSPGELAFDEKENLFVADQAASQILEFMGAGVAPSGVTLTPAAFDFGLQPTGGTTMPPQPFTLTNNSGSQLTGVAISFVGGNNLDFVNSSSSCIATLANATSCTINVAFAPTDVGARATTLTVNSSFATAPTAALSGTGDTFTLALATGQLQTVTVTAGDTATWMMSATNDGTFTGTVTFVCPTVLPTLTFCSFTPATANFTMPNQTIPFSALIKTTSRNPKKTPASVLPLMNRPTSPGDALRFPALAAAVAMIVVMSIAMAFCIWLVRRRYDGASLPMRAAWRRWISVATLLASATAIAFAGGCYKHRNVLSGTPAGTANLILQGTAQNATRPVGITLVVK